ncbi:cytochrome P450 [Saccharopolyspora sp. NFXS83]|uniref:cytochrome P450 family protein n=1 Tax=Saccharopolyspora sp. NFXS83 TaxID=2993560 RepID=UPI00224B623B|nr:cytochrome P450 [Saccharopolyspora sp. NFXS83]MCX2729318.1 cytochrome P450 [Saccharopolyspora sp. NFXS83]
MQTPEPYVLDPDATDVHAEAARVRERGPVTPVLLPGEVVAWSVSDPAALRRLLTDPRVSKDPNRHWPAWIDGEVSADWPLMAWVARQDMLNAYGPDHRRLRSLVSKVFTARRVEALRPWIERLVEELLDEIAEDGADVVDLRARFCYPLPIEVICQLMGFPEGGPRAELRRITDVLVSTTAEPGAAAAAFDAGRNLFLDLIAARRRDPGDDLTSALLTNRDENHSRLSEEELIHTLLLLLGAGHETTANHLDHAITALLTHPGQLAQVRSGECCWDDVIEEALRWQPPISVMPLRYAVEDITVGDVTIRAGEPILAAFGSANRCPRPDQDVDRFDITRADKEHLTFGHGTHFCLGSSLARLESALALPALFARYPDLALAVPAAELRPVPSFISNGHRELPVHLGR